MIDYLRSLFGQVKGNHPSGCPNYKLVMILHQMTVMSAVLQGRTRMHCCGETRLVLHCTYLAHHELESVLVVITIVINKHFYETTVACDDAETSTS